MVEVEKGWTGRSVQAKKWVRRDGEPTTMVCRLCENEKPIEEFRIRSDTGRRRTECWPCRYAQQYQRTSERQPLTPERRREQVRRSLAKWRIAHPEKHRQNCAEWYEENGRQYAWERQLAAYGLTPEDYDDLFMAQQGVCAVCFEPERITRNDGEVRPLVVDHNHDTGEVRGLLCSTCNTGIGMLKDSSDLLESALIYLKEVRNGGIQI